MSFLVLLGLVFGLVVAGPIVCWLLGLFNPIGYMGMLPWKVPAEAWEKK
jgi:hypothetical protein